MNEIKVELNNPYPKCSKDNQDSYIIKLLIKRYFDRAAFDYFIYKTVYHSNIVSAKVVFKHDDLTEASVMACEAIGVLGIRPDAFSVINNEIRVADECFDKPVIFYEGSVNGYELMKMSAHYQDDGSYLIRMLFNISNLCLFFDRKVADEISKIIATYDYNQDLGIIEDDTVEEHAIFDGQDTSAPVTVDDGGYEYMFCDHNNGNTTTSIPLPKLPPMKPFLMFGGYHSHEMGHRIPRQPEIDSSSESDNDDDNLLGWGK